MYFFVYYHLFWSFCFALFVVLSIFCRIDDYSFALVCVWRWVCCQVSYERLDLQHEPNHHNHYTEDSKRERECALHFPLGAEHFPERVSGDDERRHRRGKASREPEDRVNGGDGERDEREEDEYRRDDIERYILFPWCLIFEVTELFQTRDEWDAARIEQQRTRREHGECDSDTANGDRVTAFADCLEGSKCGEVRQTTNKQRCYCFHCKW